MKFASSMTRASLSSALLFCGIAAHAETLPDAPQPQQPSGQVAVPATRPASIEAVARRKWSDIVEPGERIPAFTVHDKLVYPLHEELRVRTLVTIVASAGYGTWRNGDPRYGTNGKAFGERAGIAAVRQGISRELTDGLLPILFRQDPRYYRLSAGTHMERGEYAIGRVFVSQNDSGTRSFNYSDVVGDGIAAALTQTYYPQQSVRTIVVFKTWGASLLERGAVNLFDEFYPDVKRALFHQSQ